MATTVGPNKDWIQRISQFEHAKKQSEVRIGKSIIHETGVIAKLTPSPQANAAVTKVFLSALDSEIPELEGLQELHKLFLGMTKSLSQTIIDREEALNSGYAAVARATNKLGIGDLLPATHYFLNEAMQRLREEPPVQLESPKPLSPSLAEDPPVVKIEAPVPEMAAVSLNPEDEFENIEAPVRTPPPIPEEQNSPGVPVAEESYPSSVASQSQPIQAVLEGLDQSPDLVTAQQGESTTTSTRNLKVALNNAFFEENQKAYEESKRAYLATHQ